MKKLLTLAALGLLLTPAAYAETAWGTINSASANTLNIQILRSDSNNLPSQMTLKIDGNVDMNGASAADLKSGDNVKLNLRGENGEWVAKSVERVDVRDAARANSNQPATGANETANY